VHAGRAFEAAAAVVAGGLPQSAGALDRARDQSRDRAAATTVASCVAVIVFAFIEVSVSSLLNGFGPPPPVIWLRLTAIEILGTVLKTYLFAIFLYALLSMIAPGVYSPAQSLLVSLCEPVLRPIRRVIPPLGGLDLSPMWAGILIYALLILLRGSL
jgi:YggT family protein